MRFKEYLEEVSNISPHRHIDKDEMFRARDRKAQKEKVRPVDLEFIGMERYSDKKGYYFNILDKKHKKYKSTVMELI